MGIETAVAIGAGSSLLGAGLQYGEQRAARKRANRATSAASAVAGAPLPNVGQDSFLQRLRANPSELAPFMFDSSQAFAGLKAQDTQDLNDQVNQLRAGAGSLGQRYGTGYAAKEALLRSRALAATGARNAGIAQNSFNTAITAGLQDQAQRSQILGMIQQGIFQQRSQQLQALGFGAGQQYPSTGQLVSQTGGDIGTLLSLMSILNKKPAAAGGAGAVPIPAAAGTYYGGLPS